MIVARIRTIKPDFFTSEDIVALSPHARLLYIALWCEADRAGRMKWKPRTFKIRYLPADNVDVDVLCDEILTAGLVVLYGEGLAHIPKFDRHQHINPRESASTLPDPFASARVPDASARVTDETVTHREERKGKEGTHDGSAEPPQERVAQSPKNGEASPFFLEAWAAYPKREGANSRADALKAWRARVRGGVPEADLLAGVRRYAAYCDAKGMTGGQYVKTAAAFFGTGEHWRESWQVSAADRPEQPASRSIFSGAI